MLAARTYNPVWYRMLEGLGAVLPGSVFYPRPSGSEQDPELARLAAEAADPEVNLMPCLIEAAGAYASLGEIMGAMGSVFGRHVEVPVI